MDGETFDDLVKRLTAARLTRLDALRGLIASAAVGLTGATLGIDETEAKKKAKRGKKRHTGKRPMARASRTASTRRPRRNKSVPTNQERNNPSDARARGTATA